MVRSFLHLLQNSANPYEYRPIILVVFENKSSLEKIPNLGPRLSNLAHQVPIASQSPADKEFMPIRGAASTDNPSTVNNPYDLSPIFVAWSDSLNEAATQPGGPSFEDISRFLGFETTTLPHRSKRPSAIQTSDKPRSWQQEEEEEDRHKLDFQGQKSVHLDKPTWLEYDEAVHLDAIVRPVTHNRRELSSTSYSCVVLTFLNSISPSLLSRDGLFSSSEAHRRCKCNY